jgi:hypothetical protein
MTDYSQIFEETYGVKPTKEQLDTFVEYLISINAIQCEQL